MCRIQTLLKPILLAVILASLFILIGVFGLTFRQFLIENLELTSSPSLTERPFCDTVKP
jgi:hypothetical protein